MRYKIVDVEPYFNLLDFTHNTLDDNSSCTYLMYEHHKSRCNLCPFLIKEQNQYCGLSYDNKHYPQLLTALQAQHPELFI